MDQNSAIAPTVIVIGNFDGVHAGHQYLLKQAKNVAEEVGLPLLALTFEPHPRTLFNPNKPVQRLMTEAEKVAALKQNGADNVHVQTFDMNFAQTSADDFIEELLIKKLGGKHVVVGEGFRFGHKAQGDVSTLKAHTKITTHVVPLRKDATGVVYSSSRLRTSK